MSGDRMWAAQYGGYGEPEVLNIGTVSRPEPRAGEVLVEVAAFSLNQADILARQGKTKGLNGFGFPKGTGADFAGTIAKLGPGVTDFEVGDRVWGYIGMKPPGRHAAAAQYLTIRANWIAAAPASIPLGESAALPLVGLTALQALTALRVETGTRVLVVGGNGGVGSTAIQLACVLGAKVDAVTGSRNDAARQAGVSTTYDYRAGGPARIAARYDAILDTAGANLLGYRKLLGRGGRIAGLTPSAIPAILASVFLPGPVVKFVSGKPNADDLAQLTRLVDEGKVAPIIDQSYPVRDLAAAHRDTEGRSASGKRVITVE